MASHKPTVEAYRKVAQQLPWKNASQSMGYWFQGEITRDLPLFPHWRREMGYHSVDAAESTGYSGGADKDTI